MEKSGIMSKRLRSNDFVPGLSTSVRDESGYNDDGYDETSLLPTGYGSADGSSDLYEDENGSYEGGRVKVEGGGQLNTNSRGYNGGMMMNGGIKTENNGLLPTNGSSSSNEAVRLGVKREREETTTYPGAATTFNSTTLSSSSSLMNHNTHTNSSSSNSLGTKPLASSFLPPTSSFYGGTEKKEGGMNPGLSSNSTATSSVESEWMKHDNVGLRQLMAINGLSPIVPVCDVCGTNRHVVEHARNAVMVCTNCGMQVGTTILTAEAEWRNFGDAESAEANRVGGPDDEFFGLGTLLSSASGDDQKLRRAHFRELSPELRQRHEGYREMKRLTGLLQVGNHVLEEAKWVFMTVQMAPIEIRKKNKLRIDVLAATSVWMACKLVRLPRSIEEIVSASGVNRKHFNSHVTAMHYVMASDAVKDKLKKRTASSLSSSTSSSSSSQHHGESEAVAFVDRYCNELRYPLVIANAVKALLQKASILRDTPNTRSPGGQAAAAIYLCAYAKGLNPDITLVANQPVLTNDTIMKAVMFFYERRMALMPDGFIDRVQLESLPPPNGRG